MRSYRPLRGSWKTFATSLMAAASLCLVAPAAVADEEVDAETLAQARSLGKQAFELYDAGKYEEAADYFQRARALYDAPTLGVHEAKCLEQLGRFVEASERYLSVLRMDPGSDASDAFKKAVAEAGENREKLLPRIPNVTITTTGPDGAPIPSSELEAKGVTILVDDQEQAIALVNVKRPIDPGEHRVVAMQGSQQLAEASVSLTEGGTGSVELKLPELEDAAPPPLGASTGDAGGGNAQAVAGWVALGVGVVGLGVGGITGGIALGKRSDLDATNQCDENNECTGGADLDDQVSSYNTMRTVSTVGFVVGGVGIAGGLLLLLTAPSSEPEASDTAEGPSVSPWIGPTSIGARGTF